MHWHIYDHFVNRLNFTWDRGLVYAINIMIRQCRMELLYVTFKCQHMAFQVKLKRNDILKGMMF